MCLIGRTKASGANEQKDTKRLIRCQANEEHGAL